MAVRLESAVEETWKIHVLTASELTPPVLEGMNGELCLDVLLTDILKKEGQIEQRRGDSPDFLLKNRELVCGCL